MANPKVKLSLKGLNQLMTSAPVASEVMRVGKRIAAAAGPSFTTQIMPKHRFTAGVGVLQKGDAGEPVADQRAALNRALGNAVSWESKGTAGKRRAKESARDARAKKMAAAAKQLRKLT